jgi:CheY-like chemotaxis protein
MPEMELSISSARSRTQARGDIPVDRCSGKSNRLQHGPAAPPHDSEWRWRDADAGVKDGKMVKVLLVEDNEMNRDMLSRRLIRRGYGVVFAVDGQQGVDMARSEMPDIVLMDMSLPVMDGWQATRCIKSDDATRNVPVIGLTAHAMSGDREKALENGCDDYDTKPVELDRLIDKIERLLGQHRNG